MKLDLTEAAISDLRSIRDYTLETWGSQQEEVYLNGLWSRLEQVLEAPDRWRLREDLFPGCRIAAYEKHVILFQVVGDVLIVVRILHAAMDFRRQLPDTR